MPARRNPASGRFSNDHQHHSDLGALRERVSNTERAVDSVSDQVATLQRDTARQIENLQVSLSSQIRDISGTFAASRSTNWGTIIAAVGVIVVLGGAVLTPIMSDIGKTAEALDKLSERSVAKDVYRRDQDDQNSWLSSLRDRGRADEDAITAARIEMGRTEGMASERHETFLREHALLISRVDAIDASLIKRPEIEAALLAQRELTAQNNTATNSRIDALIAGVNELRHDFGSSWTIADTVRNIETQLNALRGLPAPLVIPAK